jgi:HJR/Mrr/RecB family endonuclease
MSVLIAFALLVIFAMLAAWFDPTPTKLEDVHDGYQYERYCAFKLEELGWSTTVTKASGDQGVDIIARRAGVVVAIQCKFYTNSVGNKAVQEVVAGGIHIGANAAVVIASSRYTDSARELAQSTKVLLITHDDIPKLDKMLSLHRKLIS